MLNNDVLITIINNIDDFETLLKLKTVSKFFNEFATKKCINFKFKNFWELEKPFLHPRLEGIYSHNYLNISSLKISKHKKYKNKFINNKKLIKYILPKNIRINTYNMFYKNVDDKIPVKLFIGEENYVKFLGWYFIVNNHSNKCNHFYIKSKY
jgi:hypothetical protein